MSWIEKAKGLLINDAEGPAKARPAAGDMSVEEMLKELDDTSAAQQAPVPRIDLEGLRVPADLKLPNHPDGTYDFTRIYQQAGVKAVPFTSEQMMELLTSFPTELPADVKRTTALISLTSIGKTTGASLENVIEDAAAKCAALTSFSEAVKQNAVAETEAAETEIRQLMAQIEARRKSVDAIKAQLQQNHQAALSELERHRTLLEFFKQEHPAQPSPGTGAKPV